MKVAVAFSGGKDSTYATWIVQHQGWEISSLLTVKPSSPESMMFHHPNIEWTALQAEAMGISQDIVQASDVDELADFGSGLSKLKNKRAISGLVTGAVASEYQKSRIDNLCDSLGLKTFAPLWHKKPEILIEDLKKANFRIILTAVAAKGLDESWLGRELSDYEWTRLEKLSHVHGLHLTGEGGEYESFVIDAPHFKKAVEIERSRKEWKGDRGRLVIEAASMRHKLRN